MAQTSFMQRTIFDTPVVNSSMHWLSRLLLWLTGWHVEGVAPTAPKYVLIAAPHTSNWDFPLTLMVCFVLRLNVHWMGKASLFPPIVGRVMTWLGGIPVHRERAGNLVQGMVSAFACSPRMAIVVSPEGTRSNVVHWKTGFYYIALGADVPIALGYLDFKDKVAGIGRLLQPSGNISADMAEIRGFYADITGRTR